MSLALLQRAGASFAHIHGQHRRICWRDGLNDTDIENSLPLYGCLTGLKLPSETFVLHPGIELSRSFVDTFGTMMMAFSPAPKGSHRPAPWAAVRGGFTHESRAQIKITKPLDGLSPLQTAWIVTAVMRIQIYSPVRLPVYSNMPFTSEMGKNYQKAIAIPFEASQHQNGIFLDRETEVTEEDLEVIGEFVPTAGRLFHHERFNKAFTLYDEASWSARVDSSISLIWTSIEILFDLSAERNKTKAICKALSEYVGATDSDKADAYNIIREQYQKRGSVVHAGGKMELKDIVQSFRLARSAFSHLLHRGELPPSPMKEELN